MSQHTRERDDRVVRRPETKSFILTSEFWVAAGAAAAVFLGGYALDDIARTTVWRYGTWIAIAYIISRGIAKAGSQRAYQSEPIVDRSGDGFWGDGDRGRGGTWTTRWSGSSRRPGAHEPTYRTIGRRAEWRTRSGVRRKRTVRSDRTTKRSPALVAGLFFGARLRSPHRRAFVCANERGGSAIRWERPTPASSTAGSTSGRSRSEMRECSYATSPTRRAPTRTPRSCSRVNSRATRWRHARTSYEVRMDNHAGVLRVEVVNDAPELLLAMRAPTAEGGRGLAIVENVSQDWGTLSHGGEKVVWFELPTN